MPSSSAQLTYIVFQIIAHFIISEMKNLAAEPQYLFVIASRLRNYLVIFFIIMLLMFVHITVGRGCNKNLVYII